MTLVLTCTLSQCTIAAFFLTHQQLKFLLCPRKLGH